MAFVFPKWGVGAALLEGWDDFFEDSPPWLSLLEDLTLLLDSCWLPLAVTFYETDERVLFRAEKFVVPLFFFYIVLIILLIKS